MQSVIADYEVLTANRSAGEIFARAHFHLNAHLQTSPRAEGGMKL